MDDRDRAGGVSKDCLGHASDARLGHLDLAGCTDHEQAGVLRFPQEHGHGMAHEDLDLTVDLWELRRPMRDRKTAIAGPLLVG